jgi:hypothetical protein
MMKVRCRASSLALGLGSAVCDKEAMAQRLD